MKVETIKMCILYYEQIQQRIYNQYGDGVKNNVTAEMENSLFTSRRKDNSNSESVNNISNQLNLLYQINKKSHKAKEKTTKI